MTWHNQGENVPVRTIANTGYTLWVGQETSQFRESHIHSDE
jgi:hypothetical protein